MIINNLFGLSFKMIHLKPTLHNQTVSSAPYLLGVSVFIFGRPLSLVLFDAVILKFDSVVVILRELCLLLFLLALGGTRSYYVFQ